MMNREQLRQKYFKLETELFLEAARGNIASYYDFIMRFAELNTKFDEEAEQNCIRDDSLDDDVTIQYEIAEEEGVPLNEYAYQWLADNNNIQINLTNEEEDKEE